MDARTQPLTMTGGITILARDDLAAHRSAWVEPIATRYRGYELHEVPPPSQGAAALLAFFIVFYKRSDLAYTVSSSEPLGLGEARALFSEPARVAAAVRSSAPIVALTGTWVRA